MGVVDIAVVRAVGLGVWPGPREVGVELVEVEEVGGVGRGWAGIVDGGGDEQRRSVLGG